MEKTLDKMVGERIQAVRKEKQLTQKDLAKILDCSAASISNIENGNQSIYLIDIYKLADGLNLKTNVFLPTLEELKKEAPSIDKEMKELPNKEKKIVQNLIEKMQAETEGEE